MSVRIYILFITFIKQIYVFGGRRIVSDGNITNHMFSYEMGSFCIGEGIRTVAIISSLMYNYRCYYCWNVGRKRSSVEEKSLETGSVRGV